MGCQSVWIFVIKLAAVTDSTPLPLIQDGPPPAPAGAELVDAASRTLSLLVWVLLLAILLPVAFIVYRKVFSSLGGSGAAPVDDAEEASRLERKGEFLSAAVLYGDLKDYSRAAALFEKGKDLPRAAEMLESAGDLKKAALFHLRSGGSVRAAGLYIKTGDYMEAAKIFKNKGDHIRAAQALEMFGNKAAAAREFREARQFERAARLLKEEEMYSEAAGTYALCLGGESLSPENVDKYYTYAAFLALAGESEKSAGIYGAIIEQQGDYRKVRGNLRALGYDEHGRPLHPSADSPTDPGPAAAPQSPAPAGGVVPAKGSSTAAENVSSLRSEIDESCSAFPGTRNEMRKAATLRSMISCGNLEPRYAMRLWIQIMRSLALKHGEQVYYGCLTPQDILIDMQNNVTLAEERKQADAYTAPEVLKGEAAGPHSDIYSMGVILFEMVTGSLDALGELRPSEKREDVPPWLDELIVKCIKKDRRDRFMNTDDVSASLVQLKKGP
ncbi:hypothetical protein ACFL2P_00795 [Candidatus Moduliflexota bacterium]